MQNIRIESTEKALSINGGLIIQGRLIEKLKLEKALSAVLPKLKAKGKGEQWDKLFFLIMGFIAGADCLDDLSQYSKDPAFQAICTIRHAPNTLGEFLRSFDKATLQALGDELINLTLRLRYSVMKPKQKEFVLSLDSTKHEHCGQKIEGLEWTHDRKWCLDSLQAYDEFGFQYHFALRPGATHTAEGAVEAFTRVFRRVKETNRHKKLILLIDAGYCSYEIFNGCHNAGAKFVASLRQQMFDKYAHQIQNWKSTKLKSHDGRDCEIGSTVFFREGSQEPLRIVALRAKLDGMLEAYDIFDFVTNMGEHDISNEQLIKLYRTRSNAENFIRENKNGFDLKHFPCQKMVANTAYGLIGAFAYNIMRFSALVENPERPKFAKLLRFRMVKLACEVVSHARVVTFRFMKHVEKEVQDWLEKQHKLIGGIQCLE